MSSSNCKPIDVNLNNIAMYSISILSICQMIPVEARVPNEEERYLSGNRASFDYYTSPHDYCHHPALPNITFIKQTTATLH